MTTLYTSIHCGVFIGRFQPFHNGHMHVITDAVKNGLKNIRILVGSANESRTIDNPFTYLERVDMIVGSLEQSLPDGVIIHLVLPNRSQTKFAANEYVGTTRNEPKKDTIDIWIHPLDDYKYNDTKWETECNLIIYADSLPYTKEVLLGYKKDTSSSYLDSFSDMLPGLIDSPYLSEGKIESATHIRDVYFDNTRRHVNKSFDMPKAVVDIFDQFEKTDDYEYMCAEYAHMREYKESWKDAPYPPIFVTTDAIVEVNNSVLLIERRDHPGKGKLAMPGGFLNPSETIVDGMIRELVEETGIKIPKKVLKGSIVNSMVVDNPTRSKRGRTITHVYHIRLDDSLGTPPVKGGSDASLSAWFPLSKLNGDNFYEDHWGIINKMLGI